MATKRIRTSSSTVAMSPADQPPPTKRLHASTVEPHLPPTKRLRASTVEPHLLPTKRLRASTVEPHLPDDLLLEIAARSDAVTIVRCAAVSRPIRRAILDQDFRSRLVLRAAASGGFDPALLLGVSYRQCLSSDAAANGSAPLHVVQAPPPPSPCGAASSRPPLRSYGSDHDLLGSMDLEQVGSRGVLVVLRQKEEERTTLGKLCVWNSLTGRSCWLPPSKVHSKCYQPVLLDAGDDGAGRSFELLVANRGLQFQTFSSEAGKWSAVCARASITDDWSRLPWSQPDGVANPLVLGRSVVHWLCPFKDSHLDYKPHILALDVRAGRSTTIDLPPDCLDRMRYTQKAEGLLLTPSTDGRLGVLVAENRVISLWTMSEEHQSPEPQPKTERKWRWSREVVINREAIDRQAGLVDVLVHPIRFEGLGEKSGAVLVHMDGGLVAVLHLGSKECRVLTRWTGRCSPGSVSQLCLHEIDLASLLQAMIPL